jgi:hypothetical protein
LRTTKRSELFTIAICVQLIFVMVSVVFATRLPTAAWPLMYFYLPLIYLISKIGRFQDQDISGIVYPLLIGVVSGMILYAYIFALIVSWSSQRRRRLHSTEWR